MLGGAEVGSGVVAWLEGALVTTCEVDGAWLTGVEDGAGEAEVALAVSGTEVGLPLEATELGGTTEDAEAWLAALVIAEVGAEVGAVPEDSALKTDETPASDD